MYAFRGLKHLNESEVKYSIFLFGITRWLVIFAFIGVGISYSKLYAFHIVLVFWAYCFFIWKASGYRINNKIFDMYSLFFLIWIIVCVLSYLWAWVPPDVFTYVFYLTCGVSLIAAMKVSVATEELQYKIFRSLSIVFILDLLVSVLESTGYFRFPISEYSNYASLFGREDFSSSFSGLSQESLAFFLSLPTGFQWNPNHLAIAVMIGFPFFLCAEKKWQKILGGALTGYVIVAASSRGVLIAYMLIFLAYFILFTNNLAKQVATLGLLLISLIVVIPICSSLLGEESFIIDTMNALSRYVNFEITGSGDSIDIRLSYIINGFRALNESHFIGIGAGNSGYIMQYFEGIAGKMSMHNFWLELLVDMGLAFGGLFIIWYVALLVKLRKIAVTSSNKDIAYYAKSCCLALVGFAVGAVSASSVIYFLPMWILFGFSLVTIDNHKRYLKGVIQ